MNARPITAHEHRRLPRRRPAAVDPRPRSSGAAAAQVALAGAVTLGGHSVRDAEIKFGLSVTGLVDPAAILTNASARPGDLLVLTKPLGTGFVTTAAKKEQCPAEVLAARSPA